MCESKDTVEYVMPQFSGLEFAIAPEDNNTSIKVLDGDGVIRYYDSRNNLHTHNLPLEHEINVSSLPYFLPDYDANCTGTGHKIIAKSKNVKIAVKGNHYVLHAAVRDEGSDRNESLFQVQNRARSYLFIINKESVPLQIFTGDEYDRVVIRAIRGSLGIMGSPLAPNKSYVLLPFTCYNVNSLTDEPCTLEVEGSNRMIRIVLLEENKTLNAMKDEFNRLCQLCVSSMKRKCLGLVVLVTGQQNVGKTSLCHFLLNKAVDREMHPIYIDLDIRKGSDSLPGSISLSEIKSHRHVSKGFEKHEQIILQFGTVNVNSDNREFYHYLIRKMGQQLKKFLMNKSKSYSVTIIDMFGPLGQEESTINCVLESFDISMVLVVGEQSDKRFYNYMENNFVGKAIEFIPQFENIEPWDHNWELDTIDIIFSKYFYKNPYALVEIKLSEVNVYKVLKPREYPFSWTAVTNNDFSLAPVTWSLTLEYYVCGVSKSADVQEFSSAIEIEHFVSIKNVNTITGIGLLLSPSPGPFSGKCLIIGNIKVFEDPAEDSSNEGF